MSWFAVPVVFSIEAPTDEAAALLAEDQHAIELQELLDYPEVSVALLGEDAAPRPGRRRSASRSGCCSSTGSPSTRSAG